ncbi:hypothetical protein BAUCODRAFT_38991 [Baudoinia panamericana UAMH 10762]|uniref:Het-C-domain-containing protein n=1 Tax=Baudoinia panamericana (strain UAMH 10762) TaxID=717646 RepID=M2LD15_BAUPA|nr:uncharacterized protein BAUCODRAFT_38991 [Baudoinia panamericana UAMH 10762]EMC91847.1 hypothetical protein BAUCODRAFT_38991 [Baudoinia panamericana UAMH 10762]
MTPNTTFLIFSLLALTLLISPTAAFGAGNIASISRIEGHNWRHGDLEDLLKTVAFIHGHKWTSMMVKRAYFGNWLRDYSQAVDVGTLKGVQADVIRVLVWVLAFMSFGYATEEFEVTAERLGVYRPEEHIDNPKDYADNIDARQYDQRLRGPIMPIELAIDPNTGMKNYIANESGGWATSLGYVKYSFARSIHFGRLYTHGAQRGREEDLCEALRCLGQGLHCLEDFGAHTNYTELALRELGFHNVFPHVGTQTMLNVRGKQIYPLVTGTFGGVDFLHSVLGEATDHVTQTEVNEAEVQQLDNALSQAAATQKRGYGGGASELTSLLGQVPGTRGLIEEAQRLQADSDAQAAENERMGGSRDPSGGAYQQYPGQYGQDAPRAGGQYGFPGQSSVPTTTTAGPGLNVNIDPQAVIDRLRPILTFRDRVVRTISSFVEKIPGLEKMIETISEKVTLFVMGLMAPFVKPLIAAASNALKTGSGAVVSASQRQQYLVWEDPTSSDPTHSLLSKDHFSNILNEPAGQVAAVILKFVAPRVIYGWEHPEVGEEQILHDVATVFHHPALRDGKSEMQREMFGVVERWVHARPDQGRDLDRLLSSESVRAGKNHVVQDLQSSLVPLEQQLQGLGGTSSHSYTAGGPMAMFAQQQRGLGGQSVGGGSGGASEYASSSEYAPASQGYGAAAYGQDSAGGEGSYSTGYGSGYGAGSYEQSQQSSGQYPGQGYRSESRRDEGYGSGGGYGQDNSGYGRY